MAWIKKVDRNPTEAGHYKVMVDGFPGKDFEDDNNYFDGFDWCHFKSCRQHIDLWWENELIEKIKRLV